MWTFTIGRGWASLGKVRVNERGYDDLAADVEHVQRGTIAGFSSVSSVRMRRYLSDCEAEYQYMGTLTYPSDYPSDGASVKRHLDRFLLWFQRRQLDLCAPIDRCRQSIFWFLEFQARGAPHFHFFFTTRVPWQDAARAWADAIGCPNCWKTSTKFEQIRAGRRGVMAYARKYAVKSSQKTVPPEYQNVGRFWGVRGLKRVVTASMRWVSGSGVAEEIARAVIDAFKECDQGKVKVIRWKEGYGATYFHRDGAWPGVALSRIHTAMALGMVQGRVKFVRVDWETGEAIMSRAGDYQAHG